MSRLEEITQLINNCIEIENDGGKINYNIVLWDIAKSLAMIADKLCDEDKESENET